MLRLVHPAPEGQATGTPKRRRKDVLSLTAEEKRHLRAILRNLSRSYGSWGCLASVMGVALNTLKGAMKTTHGMGSPGLAIRAARAAGVSVEAVLGGKLNAAGRCSTCGHRAGDGRIVAAGGVA